MVATPPAGTTTEPSPVIATVTVVVDPSLVSVTVQTVPAGRSSMVVEVSPVAPAGMMMSCSRPLSQDTCSTTSPCCPAADPVIVLVTTSDPGADS